MESRQLVVAESKAKDENILEGEGLRPPYPFFTRLGVPFPFEIVGAPGMRIYIEKVGIIRQTELELRPTPESPQPESPQPESPQPIGPSSEAPSKEVLND